MATGFCVDVGSGLVLGPVDQSYDGNPVQLYKCDSNKPNRRWVFHTNSSVISEAPPNGCLDLLGGTDYAYPGRNVDTWTCVAKEDSQFGNQARLWTLEFATYSPPSTGLSVGAIAGIAVGGFFLLLLAGLLGWFLLRRKKAKKGDEDSEKEKFDGIEEEKRVSFVPAPVAALSNGPVDDPTPSSPLTPSATSPDPFYAQLPTPIALSPLPTSPIPPPSPIPPVVPATPILPVVAPIPPVRPQPNPVPAAPVFLALGGKPPATKHAIGSIFIATQPFTPSHPHEMVLKAGDEIWMEEVYHNGWARGVNRATGREGVFPGGFVARKEEERVEEPVIVPTPGIATPVPASPQATPTATAPPSPVLPVAPASHVLPPAVPVVAASPAPPSPTTPPQPATPPQATIAMQTINITNPVLDPSLLITPSQIAVDIERPLGSGSMGPVHLGIFHGNRVAVKSLPKLSERAKASLTQLAARWPNLMQRNVMPPLALCLEPGNEMIVMDFMELGNLRQHLARENWEPTVAKKLLIDVAAGLAYLHTNGMNHGALRPTNVLVDSGRGVLVDFGLDGVRQAAGVVAKDVYMAPELLGGEQSSSASDVYAFGMLAYEVFGRGARPSGEQEGSAALVYAVTVDRKRPVRPAEMGDAEWALVNRCWAHEPESRPEMAEIKTTLQEMN